MSKQLPDDAELSSRRPMNLEPDHALAKSEQLKTTIGKVVNGPLAIERFRLLVTRTLAKPTKSDKD